MSLKREDIEALIFGTSHLRRYTQDSPVLPDVWLEYNEKPKGGLVDLLLTPYRDGKPAELYQALRRRLGKLPQGERRLTYNESYVAVRLTFEELIRCALPLTKWWRGYLWPEARVSGVTGKEKEATKAGGRGVRAVSPEQALRNRMARLQEPALAKSLAEVLGLRRALQETEAGEHGRESLEKIRALRNELARAVGALHLNVTSDLLWMLEIVGSISLRDREGKPSPADLIEACQKLMRGVEIEELRPQPLLWAVHRNRKASNAVWKSTLACKADAGRLLFQISCKGLRWGVIDSGIDAMHPAFRRRDPKTGKPYEDWQDAPGESHTRVVETYDFTGLRDLLDLDRPPKEAAAKPGRKKIVFDAAKRKRLKAVRQDVDDGRMLDWGDLGELLRVRHDDEYEQRRVPSHPHGTHVAGILAGDWRRDDGNTEDYDLAGMCPDLDLVDLRVLDEHGEAEEFTILAALQFVRFLNGNKAKPVVHGVNLSLSLLHNVMNYACGQTPVCEECHRLVATGTVVVAAAGNDGHASFLTTAGESEGYRSSSITDPGNAEEVITVGATHRNRPFSYGVSYFSSRGPTGDGRAKPDLVAPGEKITSAVPGESLDTLDGTSMAAPHVSGAAALLMARHEELVGDPARIKKILCATATDLGRERSFQGCGMLDVLRALQSI